MARAVACVLLFACATGLAQDADPTVYVTRTGTRYHRESCPALTASKILLPLAEAAARGFTPCLICKPPESSGAQPRAPLARQSAELYRVNAAGITTSRAADLARMLPARVIAHIDGDTVRVRIEAAPEGLRATETVRLIGVDTPEERHPARLVERFAREASEYVRQRTRGEAVLLAFDWNLRDRYGRLLAYLYLPDGSCLNAELIAEGYGHPYTVFPFQFLEEFRALGAEARKARRGLWAR